MDETKDQLHRFCFSYSEAEVAIALNGPKYMRIDDYTKDGGKELFTKMHCVL